MSRRHQRSTRRRLLSMETLETRRLLVTGIPLADLPPQNFANPEDANYDNEVTPLDALIIINELNDPDQSGSPKTSSKDIDGDGVISPRDVLLVINRLNSGNQTSSVSPEQRAIGLQKALDAGYLPPNMSVGQAHELLETLDNGGHYEIGERYRNGQMININAEDDLGGSVAEAEAEVTPSTQEALVPADQDMLAERNLRDSVEEDDAFVLLQSADETLAEPLYDSALWRNFAETTVGGRAELLDRFATRFSERLAEQLAEADTRNRLTQVIADALQGSDKTVEDFVNELQNLRATLGDAHSQIAQMFANLDVEAIVDQLSVDLGTLAEAVLSHDQSVPSEHEAVFAEFLSREYLRNFDSVLP